MWREGVSDWTEEEQRQQWKHCQFSRATQSTRVHGEPCDLARFPRRSLRLLLTMLRWYPGCKNNKLSSRVSRPVYLKRNVLPFNVAHQRSDVVCSSFTSGVNITSGMEKFLRDFCVATLSSVMKCRGTSRVFYRYFGVVAKEDLHHQIVSVGRSLNRRNQQMRIGKSAIDYDQQRCWLGFEGDPVDVDRVQGAVVFEHLLN